MEVTSTKLILPFVLFVTSYAASDYVVTEEAWFDIRIFNYNNTGKPLHGKVVIGVFGDTLPLTTLNFLQFVKGFTPLNREKSLSYKKAAFHRVVQDYIIQIGSFLNKGIYSFFGPEFRDESFAIKHQSAGYVGMANHGKNTNGAPFYITLVPANHLNGKNVAFGKVVKGMDFVHEIDDVPVDNNLVPIRSVSIEDCGIVGIKEKYELTEEQIKSDNDIYN